MISKDILNHKHKNKVSEKELYSAYKLFFNTFSSEIRLRILNLLREKQRNVSEIVKKLKTEQSNISHSLNRLKKCGFIELEKRGKYRYYKLNKKTIKKILKLIDKHMEKNCLLIIKGLKK